MPRRTGSEASRPVSEKTLLKENETKTEAALDELHRLLAAAKEKHGEATASILDSKNTVEHLKGSAQRAKVCDVLRQAAETSDGELEAVRDCLRVIYRYHSLKAEKKVIQRQSAIKKQKTPVKNADMGAERPPLRRGALMMILQKSATNVPLWIGKMEEDPPELCGRIEASSSYVCPIGSMVAAPVEHHSATTSSDSESDLGENWILAEVTDYDGPSDQYDVDDIDEEQHEHYKLPRKRVIPLPVWRVNPETNADALFTYRTTVLALYPQTTCFYKGVVDKAPTGPSDDYLVCFEDTTYPGGFSPPLQVPQRYVVKYVV